MTTPSVTELAGPLRTPRPVGDLLIGSVSSSARRAALVERQHCGRPRKAREPSWSPDDEDILRLNQAILVFLGLAVSSRTKRAA
jgi:hypothetical protein